MAANALPETFVDHAEEIWSLLDGGMTQQAVADEIGWSRERVRDFNALQKISPVVWMDVGAAFKEIAPNGEKDGAPNFGADAPLTEGLLRNILDLTEIHQSEIIGGFQVSSEKVDFTESCLRKISVKFETVCCGTPTASAISSCG